MNKVDEKMKILKKGQMNSNSPSVAGYKAMSLNRVLTLLQDRAEKCECDGECNRDAPFEKCKECETAKVLNEINDMARAAL